MGRNKFIQCQVCTKSVRSDKITTHRQQHDRKAKYPMKTCNTCGKLMIAWHLNRHKNVHTGSKNRILENVRDDQNAYDKIKMTGQLLKDFLTNEDIDPNSLRKEYAKALEISGEKNQNQFDSLKPWQEDLLKVMKPSERKIIWVTGKKGAEGKSWFQEYIEEYYGSRRVFRTLIDKNAESILHTLSKKTLALIDVFVFNIPRSFDTLLAPYSLFEAIKDGRAISTKYDSKVLNFRKPNILVIFSNDTPYTNKVSKDRWRTYHILADKLEKRENLLEWSSVSLGKNHQCPTKSFCTICD